MSKDECLAKAIQDALDLLHDRIQEAQKHGLVVVVDTNQWHGDIGLHFPHITISRYYKN